MSLIRLVARSALDMLRPSCSAIRCNSALTMGLTQRTRWTVLRFVLPCFFARVVLLLTTRNRAALWSGAGWLEGARPRVSAVLSCPPKRLPLPLLPRLIAVKRCLFQIEGFRYSPEIGSQYDRPTPTISVSRITKCVQLFLILQAIFATLSPLFFSTFGRQEYCRSPFARFASFPIRLSRIRYKNL
jgi:hypothetical protein